MVTRDRAVDVAGRSEAERRVSAIAEIVAALVSRGDEEGYGLNLNALKNATARKYKLSKAPKLTELIAAVPVEHRDQLMPKLRAKPVRTASGVAVVAVMSKPHRCPHIATTGNVCACIARAGRTVISSTARSRTRGTSRRPCGRFERGTIRTRRVEDVWTSCGGWDTPSIKWNSCSWEGHSCRCQSIIGIISLEICTIR